MSSVKTPSPRATSACTQTPSVTSNNKNEIKVSADGVAKLTFNFLDELQGDSSLEPGEVKTPPHSSHCSPITLPEMSPLQKANVQPPPLVSFKETTLMAKHFKSVSQLEAEMCEEKVRAILELDAIKRRQDAEKRKEQMENRRRSGELDEGEEAKKKAKEERKRLKRLKKEQEAARLALQSDNDSDNEEGLIKPKKMNKHSKEHDSYSSEKQHSSPERNDELRSVVNSVPVSSATRYPPLGLSGPPHLPPFADGFMSFRPMNPFMRGGLRSDFHHGRGGFIPRGRGIGMRGGGMRFSGGYRPTFFNNGPPRHHSPIVQQQHRQHTPPPPRGHSPIQPPNSNLRWTKAKPSLSYAFNPREDKLNKHEQKTEFSSANKDNPRYSKSSQHKKIKKQHGRQNIKKRRSSRNSSEKSSKRKIEKIRESLKKPERELTETKISSKSNSAVKDHKSKPVKSLDEEDEEALDSEEMWDVVENIKIEKVDTDLDKMVMPIFELSKDIIKVETDDIKSNEKRNTSEGIEEGNINTNEACSAVTSDIANGKAFDMFADSPPRPQPTTKDIDNLLNAARKAVENKDTSDFEGTNTNSKLEQNKVSKENSQEKHSGTPPLPPSTTITTNSNNSDKTQLQKALDIQKRIDKLLQDDDLKLETIQATKEKLFQKTKKHAKESNQTKTTTKENLRSLTPELPKLKNPFKRSISRDRYFGKSSRARVRDRDRDNKSIHKFSVERDRSGQRFRQKSFNISHSGESIYKGSSTSLNRSLSKDSADNNEKEKANISKRCSDTNRKLSKSPYKRKRSFESNDKSKSLERIPTRSNTPPASNSHFKLISPVKKQKSEPIKKSGVAKKKKISKPPLSFTAAEFLFPEDNDDIDITNISKKGALVDDEDTASSSKNTKSASPDTDDYMDNWENDDADTDLNSNAACESSTPLQLSQEDIDYKFVNRFVNPSPPMELLAAKQDETKKEMESNTPTNSPPPSITASTISGPIESATSDKDDGSIPGKKTSENNELFGMQEIYDQFIKSVEDSGVDIKTASNTLDTTRKIKAVEEALSTSSTSTSSSSSSSSSESSSSSSATSSSTSSSEESNDGDSFERSTNNVKSSKNTSFNEVESGINCKNNSSVSTEEINKHTARDLLKSSTPDVEALHTVTVTPPPPPSSQALKNVPPLLSSTSAPARAQKSDVAKDFKKLKSLEANLARIQMMRANYDSADEISEELLKMEKLFLQEKNLILQKYAKSTGSTISESNTQATEQTPTPSTAAAPPPIAGIFVQSMQQTEIEERTSPPLVANKIFDSNREAIKLTISPLKLPKTPAIFEKAEDNEADTSKRFSEPEEADFTDKLVKPAKEIAIVKPMMESKDSRSSHQRHRRSPASSQSRTSNNDRPRSPIGYRGADRSRRSTSRSRFSPSRRGRVRSLSVSPSRRVGRNISPQRRGAYSSAQSRYRTSGRRSRSRSRSAARQSVRRTDLSPPSHRRRRPGGSSGQQGGSGSLSAHYRKSMQQRSRSRSRSPRSSPPHAARHRSPRQHSPRSPPSSNRRRSYSRDRYSRSPLPFKPPSPPMRRSLSPMLSRRPSSLSPIRSSSRRSRSRSHSRSRSPRKPRSPRSPPPSCGYDEHRRRRGDSYDRRSLSPQHNYYSQDTLSSPGMPAASSYYYNLSPNRISLDARINIVLNGPSSSNQEDVSGNIVSYESYSNYSQYGGAAYMPVPPDGGNYYANQYVAMSNSAAAVGEHAHPHQQIYSNIPTISGTGGGPHPPIAVPHHTHALPSNYYYNEFGHPPPAALPHQSHPHHQSSSLLKELPKATVAVQKGNVLEIVPSNEVSPTSSTLASKSNEAQTKPAKTKVKSAAIAWKEEINSRHVTAAVLRLSRENDGTSRSILKKSETTEETSKDEKASKKKVYFEDGIFPNRESDDEDRKVIDAKIRSKLRRLRRRHGVNATGSNLETEKPKEEVKIDPELEKLPSPPPPATMVPPYLEQPIYLRPPTPTPLLYFHFDSVVHSMYVSQQERAIPPRLINPKCMPPGSNSTAGVLPPHNPTTQSPSHTQSPNGTSSSIPSSNLHNPKKDLNALAAHNRSSRPDRVPQRRESPAQQHQQQHLKTSPIDAMQHHHLQHQHHPELTTSPALSTTSTMAKGTFQAIATTTPPHSPQMHAGAYPSTSQRQASPIGFVGMRINNFMRLPPSPLAAAAVRNTPPSTIPVLGVRHTYNMPPPTMFPPPPHQQAAGPPHTAEFLTQQYPPPPHHHHHHCPPPNYFMQSAPPLPSTVLHNIDTSSTIAASANCANTSKDCSSPQAMVAPFNIKRA